MQTNLLTLTDPVQARQIPVAIYLPDQMPESLPVVIFGPGYQGQEALAAKDVELAYLKQTYLAKYFTDKNYAFITIQHDMLGDSDGVETIDPKLPQHEAREHLYKRGEKTILYVLGELTQRFPQLILERFIIGGHSNGGDIAKYFANNYPERISHVIVMDGRRCRIAPGKDLKLLLFEATDTTTDAGVIPEQSSKRAPLEWVSIKPKGALHLSYMDPHMTEEIKATVLGAIDWFLNH